MIKFLFMDVDGTLTDGKIYMGEQGELMKAFDIKDGCGIKVLLPEYNIVPIVITARSSLILENRCTELGIRHLYQNVNQKLIKMKEIIDQISCNTGIQYGFDSCAYIGDDIIDLPCMDAIKKAGGVIGCPNDAIEKVLSISDYVTGKKGGEGAVREFIEWIICRNEKGR